jgi:acetyl-CoA acyltransferase
LTAGSESILCGHTEVAFVGGADSSSFLPIGVSRTLASALLASSKSKTLTKKIQAFKRMTFRDLLPVPPAIAEYSTGLSMGDTAEQMAKTYQISREDQDELAFQSHQKAAAAWASGKLSAEVMTAYPKPYQAVLDQDNNLRGETSRDAYHKLRPAFDRRFGTVTGAGTCNTACFRKSRANISGYFVDRNARSVSEKRIDCVWSSVRSNRCQTGQTDTA